MMCTQGKNVFIAHILINLYDIFFNIVVFPSCVAMDKCPQNFNCVAKYIKTSVGQGQNRISCINPKTQMIRCTNGRQCSSFKVTDLRS